MIFVRFFLFLKVFLGRKKSLHRSVMCCCSEDRAQEWRERRRRSRRRKGEEKLERKRIELPGFFFICECVSECSWGWKTRSHAHIHRRQQSRQRQLTIRCNWWASGSQKEKRETSTVRTSSTTVVCVFSFFLSLIASSNFCQSKYSIEKTSRRLRLLVETSIESLLRKIKPCTFSDCFSSLIITNESFQRKSKKKKEEEDEDQEKLKQRKI